VSADAVVRPLVALPIDPFSEKIGGIKSFVLDFVRFAPDDFAVEIIGCSSDTAARPLGQWQELSVDGRTVRYLPVVATPDVHRRPRVPLSLQFTLAAMIRREAHRFHGRVLQFHNPGVPVGFLGVDAPKILVVHLNLADIAQGESRWGRMPRVLHRFEDVTLPRTDLIFVVNRDGVAFYRERHPKVADRVEFLPTSVDQSLFHPFDEAQRADARAALERNLGFEPGRDRLVMFVGRLERQKDPLLLIDAFAEAHRRDESLRLIVVGEGGLRDAATERAATAGIAERVSWLGARPRPELPALMNAADVLFLPSAFEGMPITVLEALACGLPVVATAVGEVPLVVHDRRNGRLSADHSADTLAECLAWTLAQPRQPLAVAAVEAVRPYEPGRILEPFYDAHRTLHEQRWSA
jgi:glycosyltransferase involved in cell wall biosynthesis